MNLRKPGKILSLTIMVLAGFGVQAYLVQAGHQEFVYGYVIGVLIYQTLSDPRWFKEVVEPDEFVSLMIWVLFPFVATLGTVWRLIFIER